ncbi:MAG: CDP-diacylglycerol O-phosphatidyltransferase [Acidobacteria bacterium]|nr:CDP-diacylglycerol O-phosphatidyltransferase [Acidobacteriota bacterium]
MIRIPVAAWLVHLYTAAGAVLGLLILEAIAEADYRAAFLWMVAATVIDSTDGVLARLARVTERLPSVRGDRLDDIVDYVTYVFLPAYLLWHAARLPREWGLAVVAVVLVSSALGFSLERAKTPDGFFTGFPSYWNIVAFYLYAAELPPAANAVCLLLLSAMVFVPVRYVYPSRTVPLRALTIGLTIVWAMLLLFLLMDLRTRHPTLLAVSLVYPVYYTGLSLGLMLTPARRESRGSAGTRSRG